MKTITSEEKTILDNWLSFENNLSLYNKIIDKNNIQNKLSIYKQIETERIYRNLEYKINNKQKVRKLKLLNVLKYASVAIIFLGMGYLYQSRYFSNKTVLTPSNENITLQLENGSIKIIKEDGASEIIDSKGNIIGTQNGTQIIYSDKLKKEILVYNTLTVPYGKRFEILLSDGTHVHLNAGTSLKYPVKFIEGQNRQVYLKGEAFFSVAKDKEHSFIVNSGTLNIQVLGTQFNVSSYPEDSETDVVLVEGSVNLYSKINTNNNVVLKPGFKGSYSKQDISISTNPVITSIYTSWIDGGLVFRNMTFNNILKKMERHYNVDIVANNIELANEKFNASFRNEPIEKILEYFKITYNINYTINDNKILIN
ncbi:FecR family protein [Mariniflexile litorale]|uniref:FecR family protein n=1 Tax=Mariniflexile litorale TaxID=3045158 RepID=A0AAU7EAA2_9FLAO|nr:FecR family protein [Mariniflexile sp. KMM 9835]MDQ8210580.1 FecR family protein [Mariniflexile sp. KMM 9835]